MQIEDGTGSGKLALVDKDNHLGVFAVTETDYEFVSEHKGLAFSWTSQTYDPDAGDTILLIKNTSATKELHIDNICINSDTETRVIVHLITVNITPAGTTITGVNLNTRSGNIAEAIAKRDETANTQGSVIVAIEVQATSPPTIMNFGGSVILGTNASIGIDFVSATTACDVSIFGHYDDNVV